MDSRAGAGRYDMERAVWQGESLDEKVVVLGIVWTARRFYHDDWQCRRAGAVGLPALDAQG